MSASEPGRGWRRLSWPLFFAAGIGAGLWAWPHLTLPFHNPWDVSGLLVRMRFNPANNVLRFMVLALAPSLLAGIAFLALPRRFRSAVCRPSTPAPDARQAHRGGWAVGAGLLVLAGLTALYTPTYHAWRFDPFHEGESVGTAVSWTAGQTPYREFVFAHGVFQDPVRSVLAFRLFGRSIGAEEAMESVLKMGVFLLAALFLLYALDGDAWLAVAAFLLVFMRRGGAGLHSGLIVASREVTSLLFLLCGLRLLRTIRPGCTTACPASVFAAAAGFTGTAVATFAYSVDRGFYLCAATACTLVLAVVAGLPGRRAAVWLAMGTAAGIVTGLWVLGMAVRWDFAAFYDYVFLKMPRYKELMDGLVFPVGQPRFLLACLLPSGGLFWLFRRGLCEWTARPGRAAVASLLRGYAPEILLLLLSLLFFRSALGRADWEHVSYSLLPSWMLWAVIIARHYVAPAVARPRAAQFFAVALACASIASAWPMAAKVFPGRRWQRDFPVNVPDERQASPSYTDAARFLRENLGPDESFYTLTSEAVWFYLVDRPCPTRFPVAWFAAPRFFQEEVVRDLERKRVKYLVYRNASPLCQVDGLTQDERWPYLMAYIHRAYRFDRMIGRTEIWARVP